MTRHNGRGPDCHSKSTPISAMRKIVQSPRSPSLGASPDPALRRPDLQPARSQGLPRRGEGDSWSRGSVRTYQDSGRCLNQKQYKLHRHRHLSRALSENVLSGLWKVIHSYCVHNVLLLPPTSHKWWSGRGKDGYL